MKKFLVSVAVAALAAPMFAQTTPARVAVIDVQKVLTQSTAGKSAYEKLKKMQDDRMEKAKGMDEELRKLDADISTKRLSLSEDKLADMQKQLAEKRISMQRYAQDAEREIGEARDRELPSRSSTESARRWAWPRSSTSSSPAWSTRPMRSTSPTR
jgi:outer membrane protein